MKHDEMLKINSLNVFNAICDGCDTVAKLKESLEISHATIEKICNSLTESKFITAKLEKQASRGRSKAKYCLSKLHYSVYIEESKERFSCIFINTMCRAIERFDKRKFVIQVPLSEVVRRVDSTIVSRDDYENFCTGIYIVCSDETAALMPPYFTRITQEDFITDSYKTDDEIILFEFPTKCVLSIYGNIIHTKAKRKGIEHVFTPDKIITVKKPFYEEIFVALQKATIKNMQKRLKDN